MIQKNKCKKILSLNDVINEPYSKVTIELKENVKLNEIKQILSCKGNTEIKLIINEKKITKPIIL